MLTSGKCLPSLSYLAVFCGTLEIVLMIVQHVCRNSEAKTACAKEAGITDATTFSTDYRSLVEQLKVTSRYYRDCMSFSLSQKSLEGIVLVM
jgi:hypothetical protein